MNLKLFNQETTKDILFVLKDYNNDVNLELIQNSIRADVNKIWSEIKKPEKFASFTEVPPNLFRVSFFALSHFVYC